MRTLSLSLFLSALASCASPFHYNPSDNLERQNLKEEEAKARIEETLRRSYGVSTSVYDSPRITYSANQVKIELAGTRGNSSVDCAVDIRKDSKFEAYDAGNDLSERDGTKRRFAAKADGKRLCQTGWADKKDASDFVDALASLQASWAPSQASSPVAAPAPPTKPSSLPEDAHKHRVLAENAVEEGRDQDAIRHLASALEVTPDWAEGRYQRGLLLGKLGRSKEAIAEMKRFLELEPNSPKVRSAQDKIYVWEDRLQRQAKSKKPSG